MAEYFNELRDLSHVGTLIPADKIIFEKIYNFEAELKKISVSEESYLEISHSVLDLLRINDDCLGLQCSKKLSYCLALLLNGCNAIVKQVMNNLTEKEIPGYTIAIGIILKYIDDPDTINIDSLIKTLLSFDRYFENETAFALSYCFLPKFKPSQKYIDNVYSEYSSYLKGTARVSSSILKLYSRLVKAEKIQYTNLLNDYLLISTKTNEVFVNDICCTKICHIMLESFDINNDSKYISECLNVMLSVSKHKDMLLDKFLLNINQSVLHKNISMIYDFIEKDFPAHTDLFISMLDKKSRIDLFSEINRTILGLFSKYEENVHNIASFFYKLEKLSCDGTSLTVVSYIARKFLETQIPELVKEGVCFFYALFSLDKDLAMQYVDEAFTFLKSLNGSLTTDYDRQIQSNSLLLSSIIANNSFDTTVLENYRLQIINFYKFVNELDDIIDYALGALFIISSSLPIHLINFSILDVLLSKFRKLCEDTSSLTSHQLSVLKFNTYAVISLLTVHSYSFPSHSILKTMLKCKNIGIEKYYISILMILSCLGPLDNGNLLVEPSVIRKNINLIKPPIDFINYNLKDMFVEDKDLVNSSYFIYPEYLSFQMFFSDTDKLIIFTDFYGEYFVRIPDYAKMNEIKSLFAANLAVANTGLLLLSVLKRGENYESVLDEILTWSFTKIKLILKIYETRILGECLGYIVKNSISYLDGIFNEIDKLESTDKNLALAAIYSVNESIFKEKSFIEHLNYANNSILSSGDDKDMELSSLYLLFILYKYFMMNIASLGLDESQLVFIVSLLLDGGYSDVTSLYYIKSCIQEIAGYVIPEGNQEKIKQIRYAIDVFRQLDTHFGRFLCNTLQMFMVGLDPDIVDQGLITKKFSSTSFTLIASLYGILADSLLLKKLDEDLFAYVDEAIKLSQTTDIPLTYRFVEAVAVHNADNNLNIDKWIDYITLGVLKSQILINGVYIHAKIDVKILFLTIVKYFIKTLTTNENIQDLLECILKPIKENDQQLMDMAYQCLNEYSEKYELDTLDDFINFEYLYIGNCSRFYLSLLHKNMKKIMDENQYDIVKSYVKAIVKGKDYVNINILLIFNAIFDLAVKSKGVKEIIDDNFDRFTLIYNNSIILLTVYLKNYPYRSDLLHGVISWDVLISNLINYCESKYPGKRVDFSLMFDLVSVAYQMNFHIINQDKIPDIINNIIDKCYVSKYKIDGFMNYLRENKDPDEHEQKLMEKLSSLNIDEMKKNKESSVKNPGYNDEFENTTHDPERDVSSSQHYSDGSDTPPDQHE